jgi:hypothetical protein
MWIEIEMLISDVGFKTKHFEEIFRALLFVRNEI